MRVESSLLAFWCHFSIGFLGRSWGAKRTSDLFGQTNWLEAGVLNAAPKTSNLFEPNRPLSFFTLRAICEACK